MPLLTNTIYFKRPVKEVFKYVTTAGNWPRWNPATLGVKGKIKKPGQRGDKIVERVRTAGLTGKVVWKVTACRPPARWTIETDGVELPIIKGGRASITYRLTPQAKGTKLTREFDYSMNPLLILFDFFYFRRRMQEESKEGLSRLKKILEKKKVKAKNKEKGDCENKEEGEEINKEENGNKEEGKKKVRTMLRLVPHSTLPRSGPKE